MDKNTTAAKANDIEATKATNATSKKETPAKELTPMDEGTLAMLKCMGVKGKGNEPITAAQMVKLTTMQNAAIYAANTDLVEKACCALHTDHGQVMDLILKGAKITEECTNKTIDRVNKGFDKTEQAINRNTEAIEKIASEPIISGTGCAVAGIAGLGAGIVTCICKCGLMMGIYNALIAAAVVIVVDLIRNSFRGKAKKERR